MSQIDTQILDGKAVAQQIKHEVKETIAKQQLTPTLATVLVGDDPASAVYVRSKTKTARELGIAVRDHHLPATTKQETLATLIDELNHDQTIDGILLQLPLPKQCNAEALITAIDPNKDVDGFHPLNLGYLVRGQKAMTPCTPSGAMDLLRKTGIKISGKKALVLGRSNIVGKPIALMLLAADATVTIAHSQTTNLIEVAQQADIVIAAVGQPQLIHGTWLKPGAVVIDVGINRLPSGQLVGDVDFESALGRASFITPVPGGVGPTTIAHLMRNTLLAHQLRRQSIS